MALSENRFPDNAPGKFYVDSDCIFCSLCSEVSPENFKHSVDGDHDVCFKQPENESEWKLCMEALESCPVEAIGNDGPLPPARKTPFHQARPLTNSQKNKGIFLGPNNDSGK